MSEGRYRKRPVEIEAVKVGLPPEWGYNEWPYWLVQEVDKGNARPVSNGGFEVKTLHGWVPARPGEWIAKGPRDIWPVDAATFAETYEPVE